MRELDELLLGYLEHRYPAAPEPEKQAFQSILQLSDPELAGYLLLQQEPRPELAIVVANIRNRARN